jgi:cation:H+ antiporter
MFDAMMWILIFIASIAVLIKASDFFTDAAEIIGLYLGMPAFIVGVTIVSFGTTLPELSSSLFALPVASDVIISNIVGSNIANIFLILGLAAIIAGWKKPYEIKFNLANVDLPILFASALMLTLAAWKSDILFYEALFLFLGYIIYTIYSASKVKIQEYSIASRTIKRFEEHEHHIKSKKFPYHQIFVLIASAVFIFFGAKYTITSLLEISKLFATNIEVLSVTIVALGTSLPELFVAINAARKGLFEMALGNVIGANIFNAFVVIGFTGLFGVITVPDFILQISIPFMIAASLLCYFMIQDKEITKWEGMMLLLFYLFFLITILVS